MEIKERRNIQLHKQEVTGGWRAVGPPLSSHLLHWDRKAFGVLHWGVLSLSHTGIYNFRFLFENLNIILRFKVTTSMQSTQHSVIGLESIHGKVYLRSIALRAARTICLPKGASWWRWISLNFIKNFKILVSFPYEFITVLIINPVHQRGFWIWDSAQLAALSPHNKSNNW